MIFFEIIRNWVTNLQFIIFLFFEVDLKQGLANQFSLSLATSQGTKKKTIEAVSMFISLFLALSKIGN